MLKGITWSQFILFSGSALALYYLFVFIAFSKKAGIKNKREPEQLPSLSGTRKRVWQPVEDPPIQADVGDKTTIHSPQVKPTFFMEEPTIEEKLFNALEELADDLQIAISTCASRNEWYSLKEKLQQSIASYPALHREPYRKAIVKHVEKCLKDYLDMELPPDTFAQVWQPA